MLKGIPPIISPELIKILMEMGHGEAIVLADGNFPGMSLMKEGNKPVVRCDGHNIPELLDAILQLFPLDLPQNDPIVMMQVTPGEDYLPPVWEKYDEVLAKHGYADTPRKKELRFDFYDVARKAYAVVATSEPSRFANIIIKKGCVKH